MKKLIVVKQHDLTDCGPACLSSIIQHFDGYVPLETIRLKCNTSSEGTTALNLIKAAESYGLSANALKVKKINNIKKENLPCIVHVILSNGLHHYMVLYELKDKYLILMDPAKGKLKLTKEEFEKIFSNVLISFRPHSTLIHFQKPKSFIKSIYKYALKNKRLIAKILVSSIFLIFLSLISSYFLKVGNIAYVSHSSSSVIAYVLILFGTITIINAFLNYLKNCLLSTFCKNISSELYEKFSHQLFFLPLNFIRSKTSGEIISRYNELQDINSIIPGLITSFFIDLIMMLIAFIFLCSISITLTIILTSSMLTYILISIALKNPTLQRVSNNISNLSEFNSSIIDSVNTLVSIKFLNNESNMEKRLEKRGVNYLYNNYKFEMYLHKCNFLKDLIYSLSRWFILSFGLYLTFVGKLNIIDLFTFEILMNYFSEPLKDISDIIPKYCFIKASMVKLSEYEIIKEKETGNKPFINGDISIKKLSYSYNNLNNVISNISLNIPKSSKILIKGNSGSGKSTLCKIISNQLEYSKGKVLINNVDIKNIKLSELRKNITYIGQKDNLIVDSIIGNIIFERKISDKELKTVCNICEIDEIASKKFNKYYSIIDEQSNNISGGEKQRIILARGLLNSGDIIILDEALSEVNKNMENRILKKIFKYLKDKTIIYVSHKDYDGLFNKEYVVG